MFVDIFIFILFFIGIFTFFIPVKKNKKLPDGPLGLPIVGYLPWIDPKRPYETFSKLAEKYGSVFRLQMGSVETIVVSDGELLRNILNLEETTARAPLYLTHGIMQGFGLICAEGELWKEHRKFLLGFMRSTGMKNSSHRQNLQRWINITAKDIVEDLKLCPEDGMDVNKFFLHKIGNTMNELIFGLHYEDENKTWVWLRKLLEEGTKLIAVTGAINFLPWLRFLPSQKENIKFIKINQVKTHEEYAKILVDIKAKVEKKEKLKNIEKCCEEEIKTFAITDEEKTLVKIVQDKGKNAEENDRVEGEEIETTESGEFQSKKTKKIVKTEDNDTGATENVEAKIRKETEIGKIKKRVSVATENVVENGKKIIEISDKNEGNAEIAEKFKDSCFLERYVGERKARGLDENVGIWSDTQVFHVAADMFGAGTETTLTTLRWHLLDLALNPSIQDEIRSEIKENSENLCQAAIYETMRLRSIVPTGIPHGVKKTFKLGDIIFPKGAMILPLLWKIHRDEKNWKEPLTFNPHRFLDEKNQLKKLPNFFLPFQTGRRVCPGEDFAKLVLVTFVSNIVENYEISLVDFHEQDFYEPICGITLTPKPFKLRFTPI